MDLTRNVGHGHIFCLHFDLPSVLHHTGPEVLQHTGPEVMQHTGPEVMQHTGHGVPMSNIACEIYLKVLKH